MFPTPLPRRLGVEEITVEFGGLKALDAVTLSLAEGEVLGLIGPNGAGKTTLLNVISGFELPMSGNRHVANRSMNGMGPAEVARLGVARTFQNARLFGRLTVAENISLGALGSGSDTGRADRLTRHLLDLTGLHGLRDAEARTIPYGASRLVGVARAMATTPRFLLLDEPAAGLNERETDALATLINRFLEEFELGVLVVEHDMPFIMRLSHRLHVLNFGRTLAAGTPAQVRSNPAVIAAYLGEEASAHA